jgi:hypothetical protein
MKKPVRDRGSSRHKPAVHTYDSLDPRNSRPRHYRRQILPPGFRSSSGLNWWRPSWWAAPVVRPDVLARLALARAPPLAAPEQARWGALLDQPQKATVPPELPRMPQNILICRVSRHQRAHPQPTGARPRSLPNRPGCPGVHGSSSVCGRFGPLHPLYFVLQHAQQALKQGTREKPSDFTPAVARELNPQALAFGRDRQFVCELSGGRASIERFSRSSRDILRSGLHCRVLLERSKLTAVARPCALLRAAMCSQRRCLPVRVPQATAAASASMTKCRPGRD